MQKLIELITDELKQEFKKNGFDEKYGLVSLSNRPDLCQYQCNGALAAAKEYKCAPIQIANKIVDGLKGHKMFEEIIAIMPGFINIKLSNSFVAQYVSDMMKEEKFGIQTEEHPRKLVIDYGGPNIAKPLHVGHMRTAIIGESLKRILRYMGNEVVGDAHLGDWGLQMGLVIAGLKSRNPELVYFDENYTGEYPEEAPFTLSDLEKIYPEASARSKVDEAFRDEAKLITYQLQNHHRGYYAIWQHMINVSVNDLMKIYASMDVNFDVWGKESDAQAYIPAMIQEMKENNYTRISEGALVVDVKEETDTKEIPPCMILKSDGATLYNTTDLATMVERVKLYSPDQMIYITDKRQDLYFEQVFRCAKKTKIVKEDMKLTFLGLGTMNGKDGKPFKTRDGGVMRLESLIQAVVDEVYKKIQENRDVEEKEARDIAMKVGLAALKYGDLSNQISKDYIFDVERFTSFEGDTGPYILYTIVRIKSILNKYKELNKNISISELLPPISKSEVDLMLEVSKLSDCLEAAYKELAPNKICQYLYALSNAFNSFYHENKIIAEEDELRQASWISLITLVNDILSTLIELLAIQAPDRM